jgi:hypothetical protein
MIVGFFLSRTVGLPGYREESWEPPYGILCLLVEGVFLLAFLAWLKKSNTGPGPILRPREPSRPKASSAARQRVTFIFR